jgi:hypothetical protein
MQRPEFTKSTKKNNAATDKETTPATKQKPAIDSDPTIDPQDVAARAYEIYLSHGEHGRDVDDWRRAEDELRTERKRAIS